MKPSLEGLAPRVVFRLFALLLIGIAHRLQGGF